MHAHEIATKEGSPAFKSTRKKIVKDFGFTDVPFQYDPDDYYYYPGLVRPWDIGFLTPLFFNRTVLTTYDAVPRYLIRLSRSEERRVGTASASTGRARGWR